MKKKMKLQNKLMSTWKLRKRVMEKQKRRSATMLQFLMHGIYPLRMQRDEDNYMFEGVSRKSWREKQNKMQKGHCTTELSGVQRRYERQQLI